MLSFIAITALSGLAFIIYRLSQIGQREPHLPPGPPVLPILGNIHNFPTSLPHVQLTEWARKYGDVYSLKIGSNTIVVLTSAQAIYEVLDKNSAITADRPPNHFVEVVADGLLLVLARYGNKWRALRRGAHELLAYKPSLQHRPIQSAENVQLMYELLTSPKEFYDCIRRFSSSVILSVTYGKRAPRITTKEVVDFFKMQPHWEHLLMPGSYAPVDFFPILKKLPERFAGWKKACRSVRKMQKDLYFGLLEEVEQRVARKEEVGCFMEDLIEKSPEWGYDRNMLGHLGGSLIEAGIDTTSSFTQSLILLLVAFPNVQKKAQEELDLVVGPDRLPTYDDLENLKYIRALMYEVHRFRPNAPFIPHTATEDVTFRGYTIPKGATILANLYGTFHDPEVYDDPEQFNPDRYMVSEFGTKKEREGDPGRRNNLPFGMGRRICPGVYVASYSTSINTMSLIWGFNFSPVRNAKDEEVVPDINGYAHALASFPNKFECTITPRSPERARIIRQQFVENIPLYEVYEKGISKEDREFIEGMRTQEKTLLPWL